MDQTSRVTMTAIRNQITVIEMMDPSAAVRRRAWTHFLRDGDGPGKKPGPLESQVNQTPLPLTSSRIGPRIAEAVQEVCCPIVGVEHGFCCPLLTFDRDP
jgi:hypothetical protein